MFVTIMLLIKFSIAQWAKMPTRTCIECLSTYPSTDVQKLVISFQGLITGAVRVKLPLGGRGIHTAQLLTMKT